MEGGQQRNAPAEVQIRPEMRAAIYNAPTLPALLLLVGWLWLVGTLLGYKWRNPLEGEE